MLGLSILLHSSFPLCLFCLHSIPLHPSFSWPQHYSLKWLLSSQTCHLRSRLKLFPPPAHFCSCCWLEGADAALESLFHAEKTLTSEFRPISPPRTVCDLPDPNRSCRIPLHLHTHIHTLQSSLPPVINPVLTRTCGHSCFVLVSCVELRG